MKLPLSIPYFAIFFILNFTIVKAQQREINKELVLQTVELKTYTIVKISQQLSALDGVHLRGYHSVSRALLITYDEEKLTDPTIIISTIEHLNKGTCIQNAFYENLYSFIDRAEKTETVKSE